MDAPVPRASRLVQNGERRIRVSFEFFPPKTEEMERTLWEAITRLAPLRPNFVSVTYGAGGSTRERTHATVKRILAETALTPAAHLTCVAATREEIDAVIRSYCAAGVRHIVALRGDPPAGAGERYAPHPGGYANPTSSPASGALPTWKCRSPPIRKCIPTVPRSRPTSTCWRRRWMPAPRARSPDWLAERFDGLDDDAATRKLIAAAVAAEQVIDLVGRGVTDFHFYTMNRADLVYAICHLLGLRPAVKEAA
jgi:methylenetetrahydrofolate reductase (NADH)